MSFREVNRAYIRASKKCPVKIHAVFLAYGKELCNCPTYLLKNVFDSEGTRISEHVWLHDDLWEYANILQPGAHVSFKAQLYHYDKGGTKVGLKRRGLLCVEGYSRTTFIKDQLIVCDNTEPPPYTRDIEVALFFKGTYCVYLGNHRYCYILQKSDRFIGILHRGRPNSFCSPEAIYHVRGTSAREVYEGVIKASRGEYEKAKSDQNFSGSYARTL